MSRIYVDFNHVAEKHRAIDTDLHGWARWVLPRSSLKTSPMFRLYRPDNWNRTEPGESRPPINTQRCADIEKALGKMVLGGLLKHVEATRWHYIGPLVDKPPSITEACRALGVSRAGLAELIGDSRQMLLNRNV